MAYDFNMQMNMQAPSGANISRVKKQIEAGLDGVKLGGFDTKGFAKANSEIEKTRKNLKKGEEAGKSFFQAITGRAASFASFTAISTAVLKLTGAVSQATREAIKYEAELIKISQVTGDSIAATKDYGKELLKISKTYNVNISKIAQLTRTLTQTGLSFREASKGAELLAKTSLLASFENLTSTTEGLIAVMQTFNMTVGSSAKVLEEINVVSKRFAVESGDIVEAIRRTGGAFDAAGGNVEELIALFTSVRSTSRESAETIATGFRTIFGRLQRPKTIEYFKELGIQLQTAQGQFVGPFEAIKRISEGLEELDIRAGSIQFAEVVEQIGGIRQLSKVVPLLDQFGKAQKALEIQNKAGAESTKDVEKAQQGLGFQLGALRQEFGALISEFVDSSSFKFLAETFISIAKTVIRLTSAFKPLLPILATLTAFKIGKGLGSLLKGGFSLGGLKQAAAGASPKGFARGGIVPGTGNGDTVPAMLTPGEFVIRKKAVQGFGANNLAKINKYARGGRVARIKATDAYDGDSWHTEHLPEATAAVKGTSRADGYDAYELRGGQKWEKALGKKAAEMAQAGFTDSTYMGNDHSLFAALKQEESVGGRPVHSVPDSLVDKMVAAGVAIRTQRGGEVATGGKRSEEVKQAQIETLLAMGQPRLAESRRRSRFAMGGSVSSSDTVPAMLTPGEYVINKKSAQAFGYANLKKINGYAKGGIVQRFADGGPVDPSARIQELLGLTSGSKGGKDQIKLLEELVKLTRSELKKAHPDMGGSEEALKSAEALYKASKENLKAAKAAPDPKGLTIPKQEIAVKKHAMIKTEKMAKSAEKASEELEKVSLNSAQVIFGFAAFTSSLKNFAGLNLNQDVLADTQVKAGKFGGAADFVKQVDADKVKGFGSVLNKQANKLKKGGGIAKKFAGPMKKSAGFLFKNADTIAKNAGKLAKGLNAAMYIELIGGFVDSLFSQDFKKQKEAAIEQADVAAAGTAALNEYNQSMLRGIPLIGGFISAFQSFLPVWETATGSLVKATAEMQASVVKMSKTMDRSNKSMDESLRRGDSAGFQAAFAQQSAAIGDVRSRVETTRANIGAAGGAGDIATGTLAGAASGALAGAAIGSFVPIIGTGIGALAGGIIGGAMGLSDSIGKSHEAIMKGYEEATKAVEAAGEANADRINKVGAEMTAAAVNVVKSGGTIEDAFTHIKDFFGEAAFNEIFGEGTEATPAGLEQAYQKQKAESEKLQKDIEKQTKAIADQAKVVDESWEPAWYNLYQGGADAARQAEANLKLTKAEIEAQKKEAEARKQQIAQIQAQLNAAAALNKERRLEAERLRTIIELSRQWRDAQQGINDIVGEFADISNRLDTIGTGQLSDEDALAGTGVSTRTMRMSGQDILQDDTALNEVLQSMDKFAAQQGLGSGRQDFIRRAKSEQGMIDALVNSLGSGVSDLINEARTTAGKTQTGTSEQGLNARTEAELETQATALMKSLKERLGKNVPDSMNAALLEFSKALISDIDPTIAADKAKQQLGDAAAKFLEDQKSNIEELQKGRQELQKRELELINQRIDNAKTLYDINKQYSSELAELNKSSDDFFDVDQTSRGRRRTAARNFDFARAQAGRVADARKTFSESQNLSGTTSISNDVAQISKGLQGAGKEAQRFKRLGTEYVGMIRDQIDAEKDKLDALREQATAQREATQALRDAQGDLVSEFAFGTDDQRGDLLRTANAAQMAASQGSLAGLSGDMRGQVSSFLDRFSDISLGQFGGRTGAQVKGDIAAEEAVRAGLIDRSQKADFAAKVAKKAVPIDQRMAEQIKNQEQLVRQLIEEERALKQALLDKEKEYTDKFSEEVDKFKKGVNKLVKKLGLAFTKAQSETQTKKDQKQIEATQKADTQAVRQKLASQDVKIADEAVNKQLALVEAQRKRTKNITGQQGDLVVERTKLQSETDNMNVGGNRKKLEQKKANLRKIKKFDTQIKDLEEQREQEAAKLRKMEEELMALENKAAKARKNASYVVPASPSAPTGTPAAPTPPSAPANTPTVPISASTPASASNIPIQLQTEGTQQITVSLPDIQAAFSKDITGIVFSTVARIFNTAAQEVNNATSPEGVAQALVKATETTTTETIGDK